MRLRPDDSPCRGQLMGARQPSGTVDASGGAGAVGVEGRVGVQLALCDPGTARTAVKVERLRIVASIHTKVRRLRYLTVLAELLAPGPAPDLLVLRGLERWADGEQEDLGRYIDSTGVINKSLKATSAKRYVAFAAAIDLVGKLAGRWRLSKYGRVLTVLTPKDPRNAFELSPAEVCFFGQRLLLSDADSLVPLMEFLDPRGAVSLGQVQRAFQDLLTRRLQHLEASAKSSEIKQEIAASLRRVRTWSNPTAYVEHLVPPRLQWLLDLGAVDWKEYTSSGRFMLSNGGRALLGALPRGSDGLGYVDGGWCENDYFGAFVSAYLPGGLTAGRHDEMTALAEGLLRESFRLFRTGAIARVAASQFLLYASIRLASEHGLAPGYDGLKAYLEEASGGQGPYTYRWSVQDNDGYILQA